jgi:hypothetical protein
VYVIVAAPPAPAVITPEILIGATDASLLVHEPPEVASLRVTLRPEQMPPLPLIAATILFTEVVI